MELIPIVYVMVGPAGCGKSTAAMNISRITGAKILSSDTMRKELYGDESIQRNPPFVFGELYKRANNYLSYGYNVIIDATNITKRDRKRLMNRFQYADCLFIAVVVPCSLEEAIRRNDNRDRHVPQDVIEKMFDKFQEPTKEEGFDRILYWKNGTYGQYHGN